MSEEVKKDQSKAAKQEKITELSDDQLDEVAGGSSVVRSTAQSTDEDAQEMDNSGVRYAESFRKN